MNHNGPVAPRVWDVLLGAQDWREMERARIASGVPVVRINWVCCHTAGIVQHHPEKAQTPVPIARRFMIRGRGDW